MHQLQHNITEVLRSGETVRRDAEASEACAFVFRVSVGKIEHRAERGMHNDGTSSVECAVTIG